MSNAQTTFQIQLGKETIVTRLSSQFERQRYQWDSPRHCNAEFELHIILNGNCNLEIEEHTLSLNSMQAIIIYPGQYHRPSINSESLERFSLSFTLSQGLAMNHMNIPFCITPELSQVCTSIYHEYNLNSAYCNEMIHALLSKLFILLLRDLHVTANNTLSNQTPADTQRIELIDIFFSRNFTLKGGEELLASMLHLSKRQLARVLQKYYGMGYNQKLISARMDHATWLLRTTQKQIGEIAELVGYSSEAAFYQVFRRHFNLTPKQYRSRFISNEFYRNY